MTDVNISILRKGCLSHCFIGRDPAPRTPAIARRPGSHLDIPPGRVSPLLDLPAWSKDRPDSDNGVPLLLSG